MEMRATEHAESSHKRWIRRIFILFIAILLILTLYSNTLLTMNLPKVWVEEGKSGPLVHNYSGSRLLQPISEVDLSNKTGWIVKDIQVKVGDRVTKGQTLVTYDSREAENRIQDEQANLSRQKLMMEGLQERYIDTYHNGDDKEIRSTKRDIEMARLEIGVLERKVRNLQEDLESHRQIVAPFDGVITKVTAVIGLPSGSAGGDVLLSNSSLGYQLALQIPSSIADQMELGSIQNVDVKIKGVTQSLEGVVTRIENVDAINSAAAANDGGDSNSSVSIFHKQVLITVQSTELQGGEQATVNLSKSIADENGVLLLSKSIHSEGSNPYIFVLEEKKGPLGNTYHANKVAVEVGDTNKDTTIVLNGAYPGQLVIMESSEPLQDGMRVRKR